MITLTSITLVTAVTLVSMFWQPQMASDYKVTPSYKPTKREKYISRINRLIDCGEYDKVHALLVKPKYSLESLPLDYWRSRINFERTKTEEKVKKLEQLKDLEEILG